ncbi:MAG: TIGR03943 family protein [Gorillibacterium sp.]|nr:TIGR03943 family protein [Gorillibacterium sp.]
MEEERSLWLHYVLRALIMAGYSFYVVYLVQTGKLSYYIAPRMTLYVKLAAIGFIIVACCQLFVALNTGRGKRRGCCPEHIPPRSLWKNTYVYSLFLLPLLLGLLLPDKVMGSDIASVKGMNLSSSTSARLVGAKAINSKQPLVVPTQAVTDQNQASLSGSTNATKGSTLSDVELEKLFDHDIYSEDFAKLAMRLYRKDTIEITETGFLELLGAVDMYKDNFLGKKLKISGFIYREDGMKPNQFVISRLAMQCCSADSAPYGVMVETAGTNAFKEDTWISLTGIIGSTEYDGVEIMKLDSLEIKKIEIPSTPYVYPYLDDFANLAQ